MEKDTEMYKAFVLYFNNPVVTKVIHSNQKSVYAVKIKCLLNIGRYLILTKIADPFPLGYKRPLDSFMWDSLQTRSFEHPPYSISLDTHTYLPTNKFSMDQSITLNNVLTTIESMTYIASLFPIDVTLLLQKNSRYGKNGKLASAIETYQTIITLHS